MKLKTELKKVFTEEPYLIVQLEKDIKKAKEELINNGCVWFVYFESTFQTKFIGFTYLESAKRIYKQIKNKNKDLFGCVLSIENVYN